MIAVSVTLPTEYLARVKVAVSPEAMKGSTGPLPKIGKYVVETHMPWLFNSRGGGTWPAPLRGDEPLWDTGKLAAGFAWGFDGDAVTVTNTGKPAKVVGALDGMGKASTTIRPVSAKFLTVPLPTLNTRERAMKAREFPNTFINRGPSGQLFIFQTVSGKSKGAPRKKKNAAGKSEPVIRALFVLKESVTIPARRFMVITPKLAGEVAEVATDWLLARVKP